MDSTRFGVENDAINSIADVRMLEQAAKTFATLLLEGAIK